MSLDLQVDGCEEQPAEDVLPPMPISRPFPKAICQESFGEEADVPPMPVSRPNPAKCPDLEKEGGESSELEGVDRSAPQQDSEGDRKAAFYDPVRATLAKQQRALMRAQAGCPSVHQGKAVCCHVSRLTWSVQNVSDVPSPCLDQW